MKITSPSFPDHAPIPEVFSFEEGDGINPELRIDDVPTGTKSFVLSMDDIDAPNGSFNHWIVFDIPVERRILEQDSIPGLQGRSDAKRKNYAGPRPPRGTHRYVFTVFALDNLLDLPEGTPRDRIIEALQNHILAQASLTGSYNRDQKLAAV